MISHDVQMPGHFKKNLILVDSARQFGLYGSISALFSDLAINSEITLTIS